MAAEREIYYKELAKLGNGHPIYEPDPGDLYDTVRVGDVGYVNRFGFFCRVFNIFSENTDDMRARVPDDFVPLGSNFGETHRRVVRLHGAISSSHVRSFGGEIDASAACIPVGTTMGFSTSSNQGVVLVTRYKTYGNDLLYETPVKNHMLRNYKTWFRHMRDALQLPVDEPSDMLLVTGCDLTADWATAVFFENSAECSVNLRVTEPTSSMSGAVSFWGSWSSSISVPLRCGPLPSHPPMRRPEDSTECDTTLDTNDVPKYNQCTFLRSFRVRPRFLFPAKLIARAEPLDPSVDGTDDASGGLCSIESTSDGIQDPGKVFYDAAFNYIFENSDADVAIIHDRDIGEIMKLVGDDSNGWSTLDALFRREGQVRSYLDEELQVKVGLVSKSEERDQSVADETSQSNEITNSDIQDERHKKSSRPSLRLFLDKIFRQGHIPSTDGATAEDPLVAMRERLPHLDLSGRVHTESILPERGAYSVLYYGTYESADGTSHSVAVKQLRVHIGTERKSQRSLARELHTWSQLKHPNILPFFGFYIQNDIYLRLVSPWMQNGTIMGYLESNPTAKVVSLVKGIAEGIRYLHAEEIIHGDVKPENVLISESGEPKIFNFGISRILESMRTPTTTPISRGTLRYMAKEIILAEDGATYSKAADVWAFGMTIYTIITKRQPYHQIRMDAGVIFEICNGKLPSWPEDSELCLSARRGLKDICSQCWLGKPERPSMEDIVSRLDMLREDSPRHLMS